MFTLKQMTFASLLVFALLSTAAAQESTGILAQRSTLTITASADGELVRITAPSSIVQMHLEVYAPGGEKVFDQEIRGGNVVDWHPQDRKAQRLAPGSYVCVVTAKSVSGRLTQKLGTVTVAENSASVQPADSPKLSVQQTQAIGPVEEDSSWTIAGKDEPQTPTVIANDGTDGQMIRGRGALTFRIGDFFSGIDKEQMRLTEDGNLGIGTTKPTAKLDVAGMIRARDGFMFADGSTLKLNEKGVLTRANPDGTSLSPATITQNKLAKFTDNAGTVGDSVVTESAGNIGIGGTPSQALDVANGRIVTTGSQTLTSPLDSVIEVKTAVTNNADFVASFKARNFFNGSGNGPVGMDIAPTFAPTASIGLARGFVSAAFFAPPPGVTISEAWGGNAVNIYNNTGGAVTNGTAFAINSPFAFGALKPTNQYGLRINNQGLAGTTNTYGLFVDAQSGSLNNYSAIFAGGNVGIGTTAPQQNLSVNSALNVDQAGANNGAVNPGITFGFSSGEGIGSKRTAGGNQFGLDFFTSSTSRMSISPTGNVSIGGPSPGAKLYVENPAFAIYGRNTGTTGNAGKFEISNAGNGSAALSASTQGPGAALVGTTFGTGDALSASALGGGFAGNFNGNVKITGNLSANNLPGVEFDVQTDVFNEGVAFTVSTNQTATVKTITMDVPVNGFLVLFGSMEGVIVTDPLQDRSSATLQLFDETSNTTFASTMYENNSQQIMVQTLTIQGVLPVSAGSRTLSLKIKAGFFSSHVNYAANPNSLIGMFFPVRY